jgi:fructokinase
MRKMSALGIGFAGLDLIKTDKCELVMPGGTCGNVMSALASLNWDANIIKNHFNDYWNDVADLLWKSIDVNIIDCETVDSVMPRIVEVFDEKENFHFARCLQCGRKLMDILLPTRHKLSSLEIDLSNYDMLFYDRVADGTNYLLDQFLKNGKWTYYEPNDARNYSTWINNIRSCHIVKFSGERISKYYYRKLIEDLHNQKHVTKIVVITRSNRGYSYSIANGDKMSQLKSVEVDNFDNVVDSSGAGDWFTAGFIHKFMKEYRTPPEDIDEQAVIEALSFGHSLAKDACTYVGALGKLFLAKNAALPDMTMTFACDFCKSVQ